MPKFIQIAVSECDDEQTLIALDDNGSLFRYLQTADAQRWEKLPPHPEKDISTKPKDFKVTVSSPQNPEGEHVATIKVADTRPCFKCLGTGVFRKGTLLAEACNICNATGKIPT